MDDRATINPYLHFGKLLFQRILWDMSILSWFSRRRVRRWKNEFKGQKAIILCNGPSLNQTDFKMLRLSKVFCFGLNKINLLFQYTNFRPSAIVSVNPFVIQQNREFFNNTNIPLFLDYRAKNLIETRRNIHFLHSIRQNRKFARDCSMSVVEGATVTFVAMQLAFHFGFKKVALVGCDHSFSQVGPANKIVASGNSDPDHFDPHYFAGGIKWQLPDLLASELQYDTAKETFEFFGREIVNCTLGGNLEIFKRMQLEDFLTH